MSCFTEGTEESLRQSRQRLQRNFIDCLRVHDAEDPERWEEACGPTGAVATLLSLKERGEIGQRGLLDENHPEVSHWHFRQHHDGSDLEPPRPVFIPFAGEVPPELKEKVQRWKELSSSYGLSVPQVALAFAFLPSCVERIAVGCASPEQVRGNVELCGAKVPMELWHKAQSMGLLPQHLKILE
eukprot:g8790.t1